MEGSVDTHESDAAEVRRRVETALKQLTVLDRYLLTHDVNERAITHRLAVLLGNHFDGWDIDCEFDRIGKDPMPADDVDDQLTAHVARVVEDPLVRDTLGRTVFPDIIVHHRGTDDNLLALEVRKASSHVPLALERAKLARYRANPRLAYRFACLVQLHTGEKEDDLFDLEFL
jgi:hypothetical protein